MNEKLLNMSSSPHVRHSLTTGSVMTDVVLALLPATVFGVYRYGLHAFLVILISVASAVLAEYLFDLVAKHPNTIRDGSAVVTGLLLALSLSPTVPLYLPCIGSIFAILFVKCFFGGLGRNFMNPALGARAFMFSWAGMMGTWVESGAHMTVGASTDAAIDGITAATPLSFMHQGLMPDGTTLLQCFLGQTGGSLGEVSALMLIIGGVYLCWRKVITPAIPLAFILTVAVLTFAFPLGGQEHFSWMMYNVLSGGVMLGAIFMATDYVTSPNTPKGEVIFGIGAGLLVVFIRYFGGYPEGVCYSILIMNICVWLIDKATLPKRFGVTAEMRKAEKEQAKAAKKAAKEGAEA